ncbi:copper-binding protein [Noviherbaspirillum pedocola]|uniref:Copper-binding protein n=1 Tax=Noviherbaspirillum pedocola TaxID=2801341 RepID=A0A934SLZ5_9BURK|nr:copper-binding protein [Noviherbaspirillum pedocola]MBK4733021.1 copper-binding protein [Noviherbaspirillum pedocola]
MENLLIKTTAAFGFAMLVLNAYADQGNGSMKMDMGNMKMNSMQMGSSKTAGLATNEAEVKAVDKAGKAITIQHGPLKSTTVEMPPMTMTFPVQNASLLSTVKAGDKVKVAVERVKDQATVTALTVEK